jgi:hypothetical protein
MTLANFSWSPSPNVGYQTCHVLAGWAIAAQARAWGWPLWVAPLITLAWVGVKEFGFDLVVEKDTVAGSARDGAWYGIGSWIGTAIQMVT